MLTAETYIGGYRIELGSFLIQRMNCQAIESGVIEFGSEKYYDCMEIDIINPYYIMYSNKWADFRMNECGINQNTNNTGSIITVSLSIVTENENGSYMVDKEYICGYTSFNISKDSNGYLKLNLEPDLDNLGWKLTTIIPKSFCEYTDEQGNYLGGNSRLNRYIYDTYGGMDIASIDDVKYELVAKKQ
jgi:hypothetical protein